MYAGRLVDALASAPQVQAAGSAISNDALRAFGMMAALGLAMIALRHVSWWLIVR